MITFTRLADIRNIEKTALAMGSFDGMHKGHTALIGRAVSGAARSGLKSAVFTFSNHPKNALAGKIVVRNIQYPDDKAATIEALGVDYLFSLPFTERICRMRRESFVEELLRGAFNMAEAFCGFNFHYGYRAEGDAESLRASGAALGFPVHVMDAVRADGTIVSSSLIRTLIAEGRMEECARFLGRNYFIKGVVIEGNRVGRTFGFPTLNMHLDAGMSVPAHGVYVTECGVSGRRLAGVTNVGVRPTVDGEGRRLVETHLLDFSGELYGQSVCVAFLKKLREERRFENTECLVRQIEADCKEARAYHETPGKRDGIDRLSYEKGGVRNGTDAGL
ncbi:MAG: bifunctional riboflavin kinase/FAD synthetase [Clostridiales Family XIII bacterium]|jgi:riboflavin kinase/FMN adenylyltransferase|nr:bifunctional riboflavin kinase/FAD synthetase [Clostridiales Family XIII bacterium]